MKDRIEFEALVVNPEECLDMADDGCGIMDVWSTENVIRVPFDCHRGNRYWAILIPIDDERRDTVGECAACESDDRRIAAVPDRLTAVKCEEIIDAWFSAAIARAHGKDV